MLAPLRQRSTFSPRTLCLPGLLVCLAALLAPGAAAAAQAPAEDNGEPDTPRNTVEKFLAHARAGRYAEAARELDLTGTAPERGPLLARQLREVLDRHLDIDPDKLSDAPAGDLKDGLGEDAEELGRVPGPTGREPVRLQRLGQGEQAEWRFSRQTVRRVPGWYFRLADRWLREHLPEPFWRGGPRGLLYWQWLALPGLLLVSFLLSLLGVRLLRLVLGPITRRTRFRWDDLLLLRLPGPGRLMVTALVGQFLAGFLSLAGAGEGFVDGLLRSMFLVGLFWSAWRAVDVLGEAAGTSAWMRAHPEALGVLPLGQRILHLSLFAFGLVVTLQQLGYRVTSLLAGLGIGGLGVALAAQKTVEHIFGGVMLSTDQPMRVGDLVKVDTILGTVEHIGLRSTRIRTLERTIISIPNGKLADMNIETFAARDRIRFALTLALAYGATAAQVRTIVTEAEALLRGHERIWPEDVVVRLLALGQSALEIEIGCWFQTADAGEFREIRQAVLLRLLEIVEASGAVLAAPTKLVHVQPAAGGAGPGRAS